MRCAIYTLAQAAGIGAVNETLRATPRAAPTVAGYRQLQPNNVRLGDVMDAARMSYDATHTRSKRISA